MRFAEESAAIELARSDRRYLPGDIVEGTARWSLQKSPRGLVVRLAFRCTPLAAGRVRPCMAAELAYANPPEHGQCDFRFRLPAGPYSYEGRLFSIVWAVDLRARRRLGGDRRLVAVPLTMSPSGEVICSTST